ncbi:ankyrin repeat-containing protein [Brachyspira pilosicoli]|uniref:ankyrin repeat domain-containing protein n=1 Tax=Brachyspira pilosicoli TaxID=52584 RepID=UPI000E127F6B|nr:ankyrin repeat domain-containing protein [Brachyspira pilosicoli]SUW07618.1 ankyrin repeat-containing protein [Brachyspira pilosicoli]
MFTNKEKIEFFNAVEDGDIQKIKYLLNKDNYININVFGIAKILIDNNKNDVEKKDVEIDFKNEEGYTPLMIASYKGNTDIVKLLLEYNASVDITNNYNYTALIYACIYGNLDVVKILLEHKADMYIETKLEKNYLTTLMIACSQNYTEIVRILLENGYDPNYKNQRGETAFIYYISIENNPSIEIIKLLLEYGADINAQNSKGSTALMLASYDEEKKDFMRTLLENGADTELTNNYNGNTALLNACERRNIEGVKLLLEYNANINVQDEFKKTPLILACDADSYDIVKILLEHNADINLSDHRKETPLMYAVEEKNRDIVELLLKYNPDLTLKNESSKTALDIAYKRNNYVKEIADLIKEASSREIQFLYAAAENNVNKVLKYIAEGIDINNTIDESDDSIGSNALILASEFHHKEIIKILLENNADVNFKNYLNKTALEYVASNDDNFDIALEFIKRGADVNALDNENATPLMYAASHNAKKILNLLIENNADINIQTKSGYTALILAAMHNHINIVKILIENKADVFARDGYGRRCSYYADENWNDEMCKIFSKYHDDEYKKNTQFIFDVLYSKTDEINKYISEGGDVNFQDDGGLTALTVVEKREVAKILLDNNADINKKGRDGYTPLMMAVRRDNINLIEFFIENNADLDMYDPEGNTALIIAAKNHKNDIFELLLKNGADPSINNEDLKFYIEFEDEMQNILEKYSK